MSMALRPCNSERNVGSWWHALHGTFPVAQSDKSPLDPADAVRYNRAGHPIAGGYRLAISGLLADVKHMVEEICVG